MPNSLPTTSVLIKLVLSRTEEKGIKVASMLPFQLIPRPKLCNASSE